MVEDLTDAPPPEAIRALLAAVAPGSTCLGIELLPGSYSNSTHLVRARSQDGSGVRLVVRRYRVFGSYDRGEKARREFRTLELVRRHGIPAPRPIHLDADGAILGAPGIATHYVQGAQVPSPPDPSAWARSLAEMLARIHQVPCSPEDESFLLEADPEASWFLRPGSVPDYMRAHPQEAAVWHLARRLSSGLRKVEPTLVHIDYWPGNVLWAKGRIAAIVDWEEAAHGDPCIDVAHFRMQMMLSGMGHVMDEFLTTYELAVARPVLNLGFWEMAAAARPMFSPKGWIDESPASERFNGFIARAMERSRNEL